MLFGRRRRGIGLSGLLVIGAILYFSGAAGWVWGRLLQFEPQCYSLLAEMGTTMGGGLCNGIGRTVQATDRTIKDLDGSIARGVDSVRGMIEGRTGLSTAIGEVEVSQTLAKLGSSSSELGLLFRYGPKSVGGNANSTEKLRSALDHFTIAQRYMGGDGESAYRAVPWLEQGARVDEGYGLLPQLSLAELYRGGTPDVQQNPVQAIQYYREAYRSIDLLQQANSPEAQRLLADRKSVV